MDVRDVTYVIVLFLMRFRWGQSSTWTFLAMEGQKLQVDHPAEVIAGAGLERTGTGTTARGIFCGGHGWIEEHGRRRMLEESSHFMVVMSTKITQVAAHDIHTCLRTKVVNTADIHTETISVSSKAAEETRFSCDLVS